MATRARDLGIEVGILPAGPFNAITDVPGVRVGHATIISGEPGGAEPVSRTGVTAIHPHDGSAFMSMVPAAVEVLNGSGEMTGRSQIDEYGYLETPILLTNTFSVGAVHRAVVEWLCEAEPSLGREHFVIPVVAETYDGFLNDIRAQNVDAQHVRAALESAASGPVSEGNVGGGTGMLLYQFKGGIGTASRIVEVAGERYTVGVLVQGNTGIREDLVIGGVNVGQAIPDLRPEPGSVTGRDGSIIVVVASDAPLSDRQCRRLCKRAIMGLGRVGLTARHSSGDLMIVFSNHPECRLDRRAEPGLVRSPRLDDRLLNPLFSATVEATAEAVLNALVAAETMTGRDGNRVHGIPHDRLKSALAGPSHRIF